MNTVSLIAKLLQTSERQRVRVVYENRPDMKKRGNPFLDHVVLQRRVFEGDINLPLVEASEGEAGTGDRPWGTRVPNTPLVVHKDSVYLELTNPETKEVTYTLDGEPLDHAAVVGFLKSRPSPIATLNLTGITAWTILT